MLERELGYCKERGRGVGNGYGRERIGREGREREKREEGREGQGETPDPITKSPSRCTPEEKLPCFGRSTPLSPVENGCGWSLHCFSFIRGFLNLCSQ